jgi:hypothetical protein
MFYAKRKRKMLFPLPMCLITHNKVNTFQVYFFQHALQMAYMHHLHPRREFSMNILPL